MEHVDVAVIGLGPVGSAGAVLLAEAGLNVAAFEKDKDVYLLPRAVGMDGEVIRAFQGIGRGEEFASLLQTIRPGERAGFANANREWMFGQDLVPIGPHGWTPFSLFHQPEVDGYLRKLATGHDRIETHLGVEVTSVDDKGDHVLITANNPDTDEEIQVTASYVIACDGAASPTRHALGVGRHDLGYNQDWLVVDVEMDDDHLLPPEVLQVCDPDRLTTYVATKDPYRRWEFRLNEGETRDEMLAEDKIAELLDQWAERGTYKVVRAAVYQFHALVADQWRKGRIFLAGDAAHQTPPFLGQGMNAGMRDVINLAWKLPRIISGASPDSLLDSYFDERIAHSEDLIDWAVNIGKLMEFLAAQEAHARGEGPEPTDPPAMSAAYGQGRMIPGLRDGVLIENQVDETAFTGYQIEQPLLEGEEGLRLDDLMGPGFAVLARTDADMNLSPEARAMAKALDIKLLSIEGLRPAAWRMDPLFEKHAAVLVRPDKYIFGHTDENWTLSELIIELGTQLGMETPKERTTDMSTIKIEDVAHVRFTAPDLGVMRSFLDDFGMHHAGDDGGLYMKGSGGAPFVHATSEGEAGFAGLGLRAESIEDLEKLAAAEGAEVKPLDAPGGGFVVQLTDPNGYAIEVVAGQEMGDADVPASRPPFNTITAHDRLSETVRLEAGPAHVMRLGHVALSVADPAESLAWYQDRFGFIVSDEVELEPGLTIGYFLRCDRGETPTDHHTLFLVAGPNGPGFNHAAFEVVDMDDLMLGHEYLTAKERHQEWGVGRHILGSQIFDYWRDPWGHTLEHWTDGDLFKASDGSNKASIDQLAGVQWGQTLPPTFA